MSALQAYFSDAFSYTLYDLKLSKKIWILCLDE